MKFTEEKLELAYIELLEQEGYPHYLGNTLSRSENDVIIENDLINYLLSRYENQQLTKTEAQSILLQLKTLPESDLYETNKTIMRWLADGFILKREDRSKKDIHIELIDYKGLEAQMKSDLDSEKRSMQRIWKQREKQIEKVIANTIDMYGSVKGIAGNAIQPVQSLELGEGEKQE